MGQERILWKAGPTSMRITISWRTITALAILPLLSHSAGACSCVNTVTIEDAMSSSSSSSTGASSTSASSSSPLPFKSTHESSLVNAVIKGTVNDEVEPQYFVDMNENSGGGGDNDDAGKSMDAQYVQSPPRAHDKRFIVTVERAYRGGEYLGGFEGLEEEEAEVMDEAQRLEDEEEIEDDQESSSGNNEVESITMIRDIVVETSWTSCGESLESGNTWLLLLQEHARDKWTTVPTYDTHVWIPGTTSTKNVTTLRRYRTFSTVLCADSRPFATVGTADRTILQRGVDLPMQQRQEGDKVANGRYGIAATSKMSLQQFLLLLVSILLLTAALACASLRGTRGGKEGPVAGKQQANRKRRASSLKVNELYKGEDDGGAFYDVDEEDDEDQEERKRRHANFGQEGGAIAVTGKGYGGEFRGGGGGANSKLPPLWSPASPNTPMVSTLKTTGLEGQHQDTMPLSSKPPHRPLQQQQQHYPSERYHHHHQHQQQHHQQSQSEMPRRSSSLTTAATVPWSPASSLVGDPQAQPPPLPMTTPSSKAQSSRSSFTTNGQTSKTQSSRSSFTTNGPPSKAQSSRSSFTARRRMSEDEYHQSVVEGWG